MFLSQMYSRFFTSPLKQYFKDFNYNLFEDFPFLNKIEAVSKKDYLKWVRIHREYLSAFESLAVGISLYFEEIGPREDDTEQVMSYFEYAIQNSTDNNVSYLAKVSLGIMYFNIALTKTDDVAQSKLMKISRFYFNEASELVDNNELSLLYRALTEVGVGEIAEACRFITKASKLSQDPNVLYTVLKKVYDNLGLQSISKFYAIKALSFEAPLSY